MIQRKQFWEMSSRKRSRGNLAGGRDQGAADDPGDVSANQGAQAKKPRNKAEDPLFRVEDLPEMVDPDIDFQVEPAEESGDDSVSEHGSEEEDEDQAFQNLSTMLLDGILSSTADANQSRQGQGLATPGAAPAVVDGSTSVSKSKKKWPVLAPAQDSAHGEKAEKNISASSGMLRCANCCRSLEEVTPSEWHPTIPDGCYRCGVLYSCYPDKEVSWAQWSSGEKSKAATAERDSAMQALTLLNPSRQDLKKEEVTGNMFVGYHVRDHFNLYTPTDFAFHKDMSAADAGISCNMSVCGPYSQEPEDYIMVRQNRPLELVQVSEVGTRLGSDMMPYQVRAGQALAQYNKVCREETIARGMTAYKQRTVLNEEELDGKLEERRAEIAAAKKLEEEKKRATAQRQGGDAGLLAFGNSSEDEAPGPGSMPSSTLPAFLGPREPAGTKSARKVKSIGKASSAYTTPRNKGRPADDDMPLQDPPPMLRLASRNVPRIGKAVTPRGKAKGIAGTSSKEGSNDKTTNAFF